MNLSFAGCGFHGMYHFGVIACLQRHGKNVMKDVLRYGGASAGSLVAALLATSTPLEIGIKFISELSSKVRRYFLGALNPSFDLMQHLDDGLKEFLPQDAHKRASGKLYVSVSRFPQCKNLIVSQFDSRDDLIQVNITAQGQTRWSSSLDQSLCYPIKIRGGAWHSLDLLQYGLWESLGIP